MNARRLAISLTTFCVTAVALVGCNYSLLTHQLTGINPNRPEFEKQTELSLNDAARVVLVCQAPDSVKQNYEGVDDRLHQLVTFRLRRHGIPLVELQSLKRWFEAHPDWKEQQQIGKAFDADFVINLDLHQYHKNVDPLDSAAAGVSFEADPHSNIENHPDGANKNSRSEATVTVTVSKMNEAGRFSNIYCKNVTISYPEKKSLDDEKLKQTILSALSSEITQLFQESFVEENRSNEYSVRFSDCGT